MQRIRLFQVACIMVTSLLVFSCIGQIKKSDFKNKEAQRLFALGLSYEKQEKFEMAIFHYGLSIGVELTPLALSNRGYLLMEIGNYDAAMNDFNQAIDIDSQYVDAHLYRASLWAKKKDNQKAIEDYNTAIEIDGKNPIAFNFRGLYYWVNEGEFQSAYNDFSKAIALDPDGAIWYLNRALVGEQLGKGRESIIEDLSKAIERDRYYKKAYFHRALSYLIINNLWAARIDFGRVLQLDKDESIYTPVARYYLAQGEYYAGIKKLHDEFYMKRALDHLDASIDNLKAFSAEDFKSFWRDVDDKRFKEITGEHYVLRAKVKVRMSEYEEAMSDVSMALVYDPSSKDAAALKNKIARRYGAK